jgi:membrane-associated phospholipid phosphatase
LKLLLHRPDPHGALSDHGGSFPSGHTVTLVVCAGLVTMMLAPAGQRWRWLPTFLVGTLMAIALLVQAAHWFTDVLGGGLVGVAVLASLVASGTDRWCAKRWRAPASAGRDPQAEGRRSLQWRRRDESEPPERAC